MFCARLRPLFTYEDTYTNTLWLAMEASVPPFLLPSLPPSVLPPFFPSIPPPNFAHVGQILNPQAMNASDTVANFSHAMFIGSSLGG